MKRVVADTNVLVSAIQFGGKPKQLLDLAVDGHIELAVSEAILEETLRVLKDKFHRAPEELKETEKQLRVVGRVVTPTESSTRWMPIHRTIAFWNALSRRMQKSL